ncbi:uncharacterized, partial [Tachysurus ichikawai]
GSEQRRRATSLVRREELRQSLSSPTRSPARANCLLLKAKEAALYAEEENESGQRAQVEVQDRRFLDSTRLDVSAVVSLWPSVTLTFGSHSRRFKSFRFSLPL